MGYRRETRVVMVEQKHEVGIVTCDACGQEREIVRDDERYGMLQGGWDTLGDRRVLCPSCLAKACAAVGLKP